MSGRVRSVALLFAMATVAFTACSSDETPGAPTAGGTSVAVTLQEYAVLPAVSTAPAGKVTFNAKNNGPKMVHELVVVKTSLTPDKLPVKADGSVDEEGPGIEAVGEIPEFPVGQTKTATFTMGAGSYVLFCNVVMTEGTVTEVHYKLGMRTAFTVT
jgi:hypothetical protein